MTRRARRIRVPGVPADFRVPRGWPTPTDKWVRDNAFWHPPADWTPLPSLPAAPDSWVYWVPNKLWNKSMGGHFRSIAVWASASNWLGLVWLITLVAGPLIGYSPLLRVFGLTAGLASLALAVLHEGMKSRRTKRLITEFAIVAHRGRHERLIREYQRYLTAVS